MRLQDETRFLTMENRKKIKKLEVLKLKDELKAKERARIAELKDYIQEFSSFCCTIVAN